MKTPSILAVRVFSRVVRSNTVQTVEVGGDPSLARQVWAGLDRTKREAESRAEARQIQAGQQCYSWDHLAF